VFFIPANITVNETRDIPSYPSASVLPVMKEVQEVVTQAINDENETTMLGNDNEFSYIVILYLHVCY